MVEFIEEESYDDYDHKKQIGQLNHIIERMRRQKVDEERTRAKRLALKKRGKNQKASQN